MFRDLFDQAEHLATLDAKRPKQVNLRRAVSATYYAVFHFLIEQACSAQIGVSTRPAAFRNVIARGFEHGTMKSACKAFANNLPQDVLDQLRTGGANYQVPSAIRKLAATFVQLQDERHGADYDLSRSFFRSDVITVLDDARQAVNDFLALRPSADRSFFLSCLWAWRQLARR